jgi:hypothetical protein
MNAFPPAIRHFGEVIREAQAAEPRPSPHPASPRQASPTVVRLWLPLTALFLLLAPFALLLSPLLYFVPGPWSLSPLATVLGVGALLLSLGGTDVDVKTHDAIVRIKIF